MSQDLRGRAMGALAWSYSATVIRIALQFTGGIFLARILGPEPFGMVAAAWVLVGVASQFVDCGFGSALVQRSEISDRDIRLAFTMQAIVGIILCAVVASAAGPLAGIAGNTSIAGVIRLLSLALLLQAIGQTSASLLRRALNFRPLQLAQLAGVAAGYGVVALPMARLGFGVKSLVAGQLAQSFVTTAILYAIVRHPLKPLLKLKPDSLMRFGMKATLTNLANWAISGMDSLAMTRYFGPFSTGLFNRAQVIALVPGSQLLQVLQSVLFPAYSRKEADIAVSRRVYFASIASVAMTLLPAGLVLSVTARTCITGLYGLSWEPAARLLTPLALAMPLHCTMALCGPLLWAQDRVTDELAVQFAVAALFVSALAVAGRTSAPAIAWSVFAVYLVRCGAMMHRALKACGSSWRDCLSALRAGFVLAILTGAVAASADRLFGDSSAGIRLLCILSITIPAAIAFAAGLLGFLLPVEIASLLRSCCERLPLPRFVRAAWGDAL